MSGLLCCTSCRRSSPDLPNIRHDLSSSDNSGGLLQRSHVPRSIGTLDSTKSSDRHELRRIFASSQEQTDQTSALEHHGYSTGSMDTRRRLRSSTSRLQEALKKRLSRDSMASLKSLRRKSKMTLSEEDMERRKELKRALHQRLRDELLRDRTTSQGGYDTDAEIIETPKITQSRAGGAIKISPKKFSDLMRRLESSPSEDGRHDHYAGPNTNGNPDTGRRIGYEHTNGSKVTSVWEDDLPSPEFQSPNPTDEIRQIMGSPQTRDVQIVHDVSKSESDSRSSPLERSKTVDCAAPGNCTPAGSTVAVTKSRASDEPKSPEILPLRMPSITESVQRDWRLSLTASHEDYLPTYTCAVKNRQASTTYSKPNRPSYPEDWRQETIGLLDSFGRWKGLESSSIAKPVIHHAHRCDPDSEEHDFGGVDGENGHDALSEGLTSKNIGTLEGAGSKIMSMKSASLPPEKKTLTPAISLPQLPTYTRHSRNKSSGNFSTPYSTGGHKERFSSSSGYAMPVTNRSVTLESASSIYTCQVESYTSSPRSSIAYLGTLPDKLQQLQESDSTYSTFYTGNYSLAVSSASLGHETRHTVPSRRRTMDTTSFQSSTDSFRARELAAAARIVPKPRTLSKPKVSRFKEELVDETVRARSLGRKSGLGKGFVKRGNFRSYDGSEEWYSTGKRQGYGFAFVPEEGESAASLWERALQDHAEEAALNPSKRPGSISQVFGGRSLRGKAGSSRLKSEAVSNTAKRSSSMFDRGQIQKIDTQGNKSGANFVTPVKAKNEVSSIPKSVPPSWAKYPSHTRAERSTDSAGEADHVIAHDFAADLANDSPNSRSSFIGRRKKSRSMTFGKSIFRSWGEMYKSRSSYDVKDQARGFRSSVSAGAPPEYPELEIIGLASPIPQSSLYQRLRVEGPSEPVEELPVDKEEEDLESNRRSAKAWSKLYEDCVRYPNDTDTEVGSVRNAPASGLHLDTASSSVSARHQRDPSSNSGADVRSSTVDFQRSLRIHEVEARKSVLEAAEKAWAA